MHKNAVLVIGLTDQSDYSICHFMVRLFIPALLIKTGGHPNIQDKFLVQKNSYQFRPKVYGLAKSEMWNLIILGLHYTSYKYLKSRRG